MTRLHLSMPDAPVDPAPPSRLVVALLSAGMAALIAVWLMAPADPIECALMQSATYKEQP